MRTHFAVDMDYFVRRMTYVGWKIPPRRIHNYEIVYILRGEGDITLRAQAMHVRAGDLIFFRPGEENSLTVTCEPCMEFYGVHFWPREAEDMLPLPDVMHLDAGYRAEALLREMHETYRQKTYQYKWRLNLLLEQLLCEICEAIHHSRAPADAARIRRVLEMIHASPYAAFTMEDFLQKAGLKKTQFLQSFRNVTGTTPRQYILTLRLEGARDLLLETDQSIAQVAERCGFDDAFYFSRCFKQRFSLSPRAYRKQYR